MKPSQEAISVRLTRLNNLFLGRALSSTVRISNKHLVGREGLLDALIALFDECSSDGLKKDRNVALFLDKFRGILSEVQQLRVNLADFKVWKVIGRGYFGEVQLVEERHSGDLYAMKTIRKVDSLHKGASLTEERDVLAAGNSSWLVGLQYAFQDASCVYLVMEYLPGGDLEALLQRLGGRLEENVAQFYLAEVVAALRVLHTLGFAHRDVKPDNVLLDRCGHTKLGDFGSAARLTPAGLVTAPPVPVGTPQYVAPEVLAADVPYGAECDFWSVGVLAYRLVMGVTPFDGDGTASTYHNILSHKGLLDFPEKCTTQFRTLVSELLTDRSTRLQIDQILEHVFFTDVDWANLHNSEPPFVPVVKGPDDTSNFGQFDRKRQTPNIEDFVGARRGDFSGRDLPFVGLSYAPPGEAVLSLPQKASIKSSQEVVLDQLQRRLTLCGDDAKVGNLERAAEEAQHKVEMLEKERNALEIRLEKSLGETASVRRLLVLEREERKVQETRAVAMVREGRARWEAKHRAQITTLQKSVQEHAARASQLEGECNKLREQLQYRGTELEEARAKTVRLFKKQESSRRSLDLLDAEKQQVVEIQQQKVEAEQQLAAVMQQKQALSEQVTTLITEREALVAELKEAKEQRAFLENELSVTRSEAIGNKVTALEAQLATEKKSCSQLREKLQGLQAELSDSLLSQQSSTLARDVEHETLVETLQEELHHQEKVREKLETQLAEREQVYEESLQKVNSLEALLRRLEAGLERLEAENIRLRDGVAGGAELKAQRSCLVEQVEKLEAQLENVREVSVSDRQAARCARLELWKKEQELSNVRVDLRIAQREVRTQDTTIKSLQQEKSRLESQLQQECEKVATLQADNMKIAQQLELAQECSQQLKCAQQEAQCMSRELMQTKERVKTLEAQLMSLQSEQLRLAGGEQKAAVLASELERERAKIASLELNITALRDTACELENQLEDYEKLTDSLKEQRSKLLQDREELEARLATVRGDLATAQQQLEIVNVQQRNSEDCLKETRAQLCSTEEQLTSFRKLAADLTQQVTRMEDEQMAQQLEARTARRREEALSDELNLLKEEASAHLTTIQGLKEGNKRLAVELGEVEGELSALQDRYASLEAAFTECQAFHKHREYKMDATLKQQTKLISYLQARVEQGGKRRTLAARLFGRGKENNPTPVVVPEKQLTHSFTAQPCAKNVQCPACPEAVVAGCSAAVCEACKLVAHPKCSLLLPATCGTPLTFSPKPKPPSSPRKNVASKPTPKPASPEQPTKKDHVLLETELELTCALPLSEDLLVLGTETGLFSLRLSGLSTTPVSLGTSQPVQQLESWRSEVLMLTGHDRTLQHCDLRALTIAAEAAACSHPRLPTTHPIVEGGCHVFGVGGDGLLCAAKEDAIMLFRWDCAQCNFCLVRVLDTAEPCSCLLFVDKAVVVGADQFFLLDSELNVCELPAPPLSGCFPVGAVRTGPSEVLLCYSEVGHFVNLQGRHSSRQDIYWSHLPFYFAHYKNYLLVVYSSSIEVLRLGEGDPLRVCKKLPTPRYLCPAPKGVYLATRAHRGPTVLMCLDATTLFSGCVSDSDESTEFSFSSQIQSLDESSEDGSPEPVRHTPL